MSQTSHWSPTMRTWRLPLAAFIAVAAIGYGARWAIGNIYGAAEAIDLLESLSRAGLYLASAIATASATTLALMLTLIGMLNRVDQQFDRQTYGNIDVIAKLATASLFLALLVLLAFVFPMGEFDKLPGGWYPLLYDVLFGACTLMIGLLAATVTVTYSTVRLVISKVTPGDGI